MFVVQFYRLMSTNETSNPYLLHRLLVLLPDQGGLSFTTKCKFHYQPTTQTINFTNTFSQLSRNNQHLQHLLQNSQLFYLDERHRTKHFLGQFPLEDCRLFFDDWAASSILISYRKHDPPPIKHGKQVVAGKKSRERTIKEVKTYIEQWRQVAQSSFSTGSKGITLIKAAQAIGMSKKSLDDYLRYLRIAERLNFDFQAYQTQKMGFLRAFVKTKLREPFDRNILDEIDNYWDSTYISKEQS